MSQPPAFQMYASDYLSSSKVQRMTLEAEGAYCRLLFFSWQDGSIPADIKEMAPLCKITPRRMAVLWDVYLKDCWVPLEGRPGRLVSPRMEKVRSGHSNFSESQRRRAQAGWNTRRLNTPADAPALPQVSRNGSPGNALQSPVSSIPPIVPHKKPKASLPTGSGESVYSPDFEIFWTAYPRKIGKGDAWEAWRKLKPSIALQEIILKAIAVQRKWPEWNRETRFIPHASTWLNKHRWDDGGSEEIQKGVHEFL